MSPHPDRNARGRWAEEVAVRHLAARGLVCRARNFRSRFGEIDLIMEDGGEVVFVEVRSRARATLMAPEESVDGGKQARLVRTAEIWLSRRRWRRPPPCRFDVVAVTGNPDAVEVHWCRNAFDA